MHSEGTASDDSTPAGPGPGDVIAGKYRVEKLVGSGGMGVVLAAQHLQLGQSVAIKVLSVSGLDAARRSDACTRFLREGQAAARLVSDHVVRIYDVGTLETGAPFMVMELLRGEDLSTLLDRKGPAPVEVAIDYITQASDAVGEAHAGGIVHRDLKPSNLFVSRRSDGRALVKVLDFGISKAILPGSDGFNGSLTETRSVVGSPYYMSPEQVRDSKRVDTRTDIWSLGMILYELLVGEPAFNASTLPGICAAIAADEPPPVRSRRPEVPAEVEAAVMQCLQKDPAKRPQNVGELVRALAPFAPRGAATSSSDYASLKALEPSASPLAQAAARNYATLQLPEAAESGPRLSGGALRVDIPNEPVGAIAASSPRAASASSRDASRRGAPDDTLLSPSGAMPQPALPQVPAPTSTPRHGNRLVLVATLVGALVAGGVVVAFRSSASTGAGETAARPSRFSLAVDSVPRGASVFEGDRVLGTTPLSIPIEGAPASAARHFTVRLDGYEPYAIEQGASEHDVRVLASLKERVAPEPAKPPLAQPPAEAPVVEEAKAAARPARVAPRSKPPAPHAPPPAPAKSAVSDIRLER